MNKRMLRLFGKAFGLIVGSVFNVVFMVVIVVFIYNYANKGFVFGEEFAGGLMAERVSSEVTLVIPEGADAWEISKLLKENGMIPNEYVFYLQTRFNGTYNLLKPGTYALDTAMSDSEIISALQSTKLLADAMDDLKVTLPEGYTLKQMGDVFESHEMFTCAEFLEACESELFNYWFLDDAPEGAKRLEGFLFPDTYFFLKEASPRSVIVRMLDRFDEIYSGELAMQAEDSGLSVREVVIAASIIEKEIVVASERTFCSAVIRNRLEKGIPLEMCSTVLYALDKRKDRLLLADLDVESPYNTYRHAGLPAGPIGAPGKAAMVAALNPADVGYLYFVLKDEETGEHTFTSNYDEFVDAKARYNQIY